jgi:hypothetical protein
MSDQMKKETTTSINSRLAENGFMSWHKHWKGIYLHCVHPRYCVRFYLWGFDYHRKAQYALGRSNKKI